MESEIFELLDDDGKRVVLLAREEALALGDDHIRPEHLLLGVLGGPTSPSFAALLESIGLSLDHTRLVVAPHDPNPGTPDGLIPFAEDSRRALRDCVRDARDEGRTRVGPEHVLLGVLGVDNRRVSAAITPYVAVADLMRCIREMHNGTT